MFLGFRDRIGEEKKLGTSIADRRASIRIRKNVGIRTQASPPLLSRSYFRRYIDWYDRGYRAARNSFTQRLLDALITDPLGPAPSSAVSKTAPPGPGP